MNDLPMNLAHALQRIADIETRLHEFDGTGAAPSQADGPSPFAGMVNGLCQQGEENPPVVPPYSAKCGPSNRRVPTTDEMETLVTKAAAQYRIRPELLRALVQAESGFNPLAISPKGAQGLTQLMPETASTLGVSDPFDPEQNVMAGARYLRQQLDRFGGNERLALAAYNAGPGAVLRYNDVPPYPETRQYVARVMALAGNNLR